MSNFYSGQHGSMWFSSADHPEQKAGQVTNWSINSNMSALPTTTLEQTDQTYINGLRSTSGSCRLFYYGTDSSASKLLSTLLITRKDAASPGVALHEQQNVKFKFKVLGAGDIEVEALITSANMAVGVGEVLAIDLQFQVTGAIEALTL